MTQPHLSRAPIVEALVDLRVRMRDDFDVAALRTLHGSIQDDYPVVEEQRLTEGRFQLGQGGIISAAQDRSLRGFRVKGDDGRNIAQFRIDGFTFSRLAPYESWNALFAEGWRLWETYRARSEPRGVTRLATRFINRLVLPDESRLEDIFTAPPDVPQGVPDTFASFLYRYVLTPTNGITSNVTMATEANAPGQESLSIVFDIDCYVQEDLAPDADEVIRGHFEDLREMKNRIFFRSLTPTALEAYR